MLNFAGPKTRLIECNQLEKLTLFGHFTRMQLLESVAATDDRYRVVGKAALIMPAGAVAASLVPG